VIRSTCAASPRASPLHPASYRARGRSCFEVRRFKGETSLKLVALVRGAAATESLVERYNDSRTVEGRNAGISYWAPFAPKGLFSRTVLVGVTMCTGRRLAV
jgi:hypothetical protein